LNGFLFNIASFFQPSGMIWRFDVPDKTIFLTFDDGPIPALTPWVLDKLRQFQAKATFFCVGDNVTRYPEIFAEIINQGHSVGNHTFHHLNGWKVKDEDYIDDIKKCSDLVDSSLFRPPYGKIKRSQFRALKHDYRVLMWSVLSMDYDKKVSPGECLDISKKYSKAGSIIVFHDNVKAEANIRFALPQYLEHFSNKGYKFSQII
jgi:peptidoglycan-N-acetylglucosamine deacetylase